LFNLKKRNNPHDALIERVILQMEEVQVDSDEYSRLMTSLERLTKLKGDNKPQQVSPDTVLLVCGNLAGVILVLGHERFHVITTRAFQGLITPR
jgi:hypothetical protein